MAASDTRAPSLGLVDRFKWPVGYVVVILFLFFLCRSLFSVQGGRLGQ